MYKQIALFLFATTLALTSPIVSTSARAATAETAPPDLLNIITALDTAANSRDINAVMQLYAPQFQHSDGLNKDKLRESLQELWQRYKQIQYRTELTRWERKDDSYAAETVTTVQGVKGQGASDFKLEAKLISTQVYKNINGKWQVVSQSIVTEKSSLTSGEKPPKVDLRLPENIGVGRQFSLDAVMPEPLGTSLLLGAVIDESVSPGNYFKDTTVDLEPLKAGGVFKIGQASYSPGDRWISVVLVREDGITIASQRLRVSRGAVGNQYTPLPESGITPSRVRPNPDSRPTS